jgi:hypothetical protein
MWIVVVVGFVVLRVFGFASTWLGILGAPSSGEMNSNEWMCDAGIFLVFPPWYY